LAPSLQTESLAGGPIVGITARPLAIGSEQPGIRFISNGIIENGGKPIAYRFVVHGDENFDPSIQVALHEVGRPERDPKRTP
jgi:hypothetical protein